jgi:uncharacterized delta-60 repeat protein
LDLTFGGTGNVTTNLGLRIEGATSVVVQPWDNKIVVASRDWNPNIAGSYLFALARYNSNGTPDTSFGNGGIVTSNVTSGNDQINQILLTSNQKILAIGYGYAKSGQAVVVARYNANGTLDTSFGSGGSVVTAMSGKGSANALVAALDPTGKLVVGGKGNGVPILLRYTTAGALDTTFGNKGMVLGTSGSNVADVWQALQIQPVGTSYQIVAAGFDGSNGHGAIARFNANGTVVSAFGTKGEVAVNLPGGGTTVPMVFQPDGKLVAVYETGLSDDAIVLSRFNVNGTPDGGFGTGGQVVTDVNSLFGGSPSYASPFAVGIDPSGRIVLSGKATGGGAWVNSLLLRYTSTGALDSSFGTNGAVLTLVGGTLGGQEQRYTALAFQPDGEIVTAGYVTTEYNPNTGSSTSLLLDVARYISDTTTSALSSLAATSPMSTSSSTPDSFLSPLALDSLLFEDPLTPVSKRSSRSAV